jgi:hypothetical protein
MFFISVNIKVLFLVHLKKFLLLVPKNFQLTLLVATLNKNKTLNIYRDQKYIYPF